MRVYLCEHFCVLQTSCRQSQACLVQMGLTVTVPSVETKPQGNITGPPAVTAVKASSDAPYERATSTPAGTENRNILWEHAHMDLKPCYAFDVCFNTLLFSWVIMSWHVTLQYMLVCCYTLFHRMSRSVKLLISLECLSYAGSADSALWIKIRGISVVSADLTNASELAWKKKVWHGNVLPDPGSV